MTKQLKPGYERLVNTETDRFANLPATWKVDCETFSDEKTLYDFQQEALQDGLRLLHHFTEYYEEYDNYDSAKESLFDDLNQNTDRYAEDKDLRLQKGDLNETFKYLRERYPVEERSRYGYDYEEVDFKNFANRMGFWMATGSGKTVLAIKFVEALHTLIQRGQVPDRDILLLTHQDGILEQFEEEIAEYNAAHDTKIKTWDVREYTEVKRGGKIGTRGDINIFTYRSDLISDETKEKEVNFEDFENNGEWYVLLDEAHKGESSTSKQQAYYSMLSRNGFLFNFSATFTDPSDIISTVYNFNIKEFTQEGYGKQIYISDSDIHALTDADFDPSEKRKVVLKSLIALTIQKQAADAVDFEYHNPLLTAFVNTVNTKDADLELFFQEIEDIAKEHREDLFESAKQELYEDLTARDTYAFSDSEEVKWGDIRSISKKEVLEAVYNSKTHSSIEIQHSPDDNKELVFSLKTSSKPFALMRIGRKSEWLKTKLSGREVEEEMNYQSYFDNLNDADSTINLLLGSRSFYEGWDSNRPNVMLFINLGKSDKRKFILQAIGRGMRIEPHPDERKRLRKPPKGSNASLEHIRSLETLLVFGTSTDSLDSIVDTIKEINDASYHDVEGIEENENDEYQLLIPDYGTRDAEVVDEIPRFPYSKESVTRAWEWLGDDKLLFAYLRDLDYDTLRLMKDFSEAGDFGSKEANGLDVLTEFRQHIDATRYEIDERDGFKPVEDNSIVHFNDIRADFDEEDHKEKLEDTIKTVRDAGEDTLGTDTIFDLLESGEIEREEAERLIEESKSDEETMKEVCREYGVTIQQSNSHYYSPILYLNSDVDSKFQHIIDVESEVGFIESLFEYDDETGLFENAEWWKFSKLSERKDKVFIPYGNDERFLPDFIFWAEKGDEYKIIFVDPKSPNYSQALAKIDGYEDLFTKDGEPIVFEHDGKQVSVHLRLFNEQTMRNNEWADYQEYWINGIDDLDDLV